MTNVICWTTVNYSMSLWAVWMFFKGTLLLKETWLWRRELSFSNLWNRRTKMTSIYDIICLIKIADYSFFPFCFSTNIPWLYSERCILFIWVFVLFKTVSCEHSFTWELLAVITVLLGYFPTVFNYIKTCCQWQLVVMPIHVWRYVPCKLWTTCSHQYIPVDSYSGDSQRFRCNKTH